MRLHDEDPYYQGDYDPPGWEFWSVFVLLGLVMILLAVLGKMVT